jgi:D-threo-aldose 1-dehydrogenase
MQSRRSFISSATLATAAIATSQLPNLAFGAPVSPVEPLAKPANQTLAKKDIILPGKIGAGGVALGNGFHENTNTQIQQTLAAFWDAGIRYYDTSPFYGFGLSERRLGHFLFEKDRKDFVISTKVGRVFEADRNYKKDPKSLWYGNLNFKYRYDYTAAGVRRSVEDSLLRLGLSSIDYVFVHDLSSDNADFGPKWVEQFAIAQKGAFPELTKMREEGLIKGWGMGVNTPEPILKSMEVADPDLMLVAIQYSLLDHEHALNVLFPAMEKKGVKAVIGGPLNSGLLGGKPRYNYSSEIPADIRTKKDKIAAIADKYGVSLVALSLQFSAAHPVVSSVIPGASTAAQAIENAAALAKPVPAALWKELVSNKLISAKAPLPKV